MTETCVVPASLLQLAVLSWLGWSFEVRNFRRNSVKAFRAKDEAKIREGKVVSHSFINARCFFCSYASFFNKPGHIAMLAVAKAEPAETVQLETRPIPKKKIPCMPAVRAFCGIKSWPPGEKNRHLSEKGR